MDLRLVGGADYEAPSGEKREEARAASPDLAPPKKRKGKLPAQITVLTALPRAEQEGFIQAAHDAIMNRRLPVFPYVQADGRVFESPHNRFESWTVKKALVALASSEQDEKNILEYLLKQLGVQMMPSWGTMMADAIDASGIRDMSEDDDVAAIGPGEYTIEQLDHRRQQAARLRAVDGASSRPLAYMQWPGSFAYGKVKAHLKPLEDYADIYSDLPLYSDAYVGQLAQDFDRIIRRYKPLWADQRLYRREMRQNKPFAPDLMTPDALRAARLQAGRKVLSAIAGVKNRTVALLIQDALSADTDVQALARRELQGLGITLTDNESTCVALVTQPSQLYARTGNQLRLYKKVIGSGIELHMPRVGCSE